MSQTSTMAICPYCGSNMANNKLNAYQFKKGFTENIEFFSRLRYAIISLTFSPMGARVLWVHITPLSEDDLTVSDDDVVASIDGKNYAVSWRTHPMVLDTLVMATTLLAELSRLSPNFLHNIVTAKPMDYRGTIPQGLTMLGSLNHWKTESADFKVNDFWLFDRLR